MKSVRTNPSSYLLKIFRNGKLNSKPRIALTPKQMTTRKARPAFFLKKYFSLRARAGLETQAALAKASGLKRSYVATIETGEHFPQQKTLQKLAKAFGVDVTELFP